MKKKRPAFSALVLCDSTGKAVTKPFKYMSAATRQILSSDGSFQYELKPLLPPKQLPLFPSSFVHFRGGCPRTRITVVSVLIWVRG